MSNRAERLGLEPESIDLALGSREAVEPQAQSPAREREVQYSIAISLKRIADLEERMLRLHEIQAAHLQERQHDR